MKHIFHIVAASGDAVCGEGVIGKGGQLPWKYSDDLKFFKATTMGHTVIMGRKTFESIGKPLLGRENIVISRSNFQSSPEIKVFHSIEQAIENASNEKVFIIGGAEVYKQTIPMAEGIYLTRVPGSYEGDIKYPPIPSIFKENEEQSKQLQEKFNIPIVYFENTGGTANFS